MTFVTGTVADVMSLEASLSVALARTGALTGHRKRLALLATGAKMGSVCPVVQMSVRLLGSGNVLERVTSKCVVILTRTLASSGVPSRPVPLETGVKRGVVCSNVEMSARPLVQVNAQMSSLTVSVAMSTETPAWSGINP